MQNLVLHEGRPENTEGREEKEIRVYDLLDSLGIHYWRTDHEHADTMEACQDIDAVLDCLICKNLFLCNRQKTEEKINFFGFLPVLVLTKGYFGAILTKQPFRGVLCNLT